MATAVLKVPVFSSVDPTLQADWDLNTFGGLPAYEVDGTTDIGDALRTEADAKFVKALNSIDVFPFTDHTGLAIAFGYLYFIDEGAIPIGATINSVRYRIDLDATLAWVSSFNTGHVNIFNNDGSLAFPIEIVGLSDSQFTGSGTFRTDPQLVSPVTGLPWTFADLYAPDQTGASLQGWWFVDFRTDTTGLTDPQIDSSALTFNYVVLEVDYTAGPATAALDQLPIEVVYDFSLLADVPTVFTTTDPLPAGLTLNPDGTITGTPTVTGAFPITVTATGPGWPIDIPVTIVTVAGVPVDEPVAVPGAEGVSIPRGPGECAGVAYGIGVLGSPGGTAGTGDPMSTVAIDLKQFFGGASHAPPALGFLRAYAAGGTTPLDTFANSSLATPNAWPIQLDADGNSPVPIFLGPFIYKFDLQTAAGASLPGFPKDNIAGSVWPGQVLGAVTVNPIANADGIGHSFSSTLNKAASGTHALFAGVRILAPTIGAGSATLTEAATLSIAGPPLGGTTRYVMHIEQGDILLTDNASKLGFYGHAVVAQQLLATGAGHTVDDVIGALQALGLVKQS